MLGAVIWAAIMLGLLALCGWIVTHPDAEAA